MAIIFMKDSDVAIFRRDAFDEVKAAIVPYHESESS